MKIKTGLRQRRAMAHLTTLFKNLDSTRRKVGILCSQYATGQSESQ